VFLTVTASSIVIFPDGGWNNLPAPLQKLFKKLSDQHAIYFITNGPLSAHAPSAVTALSLKQLTQINWSETAAVVMHPCWIEKAVAAKPKHLIAMPDSPRQGEPALCTKCRKWLCAHADLIIADAEPYYLEQAFCTEHVFLLDGRDEVCDLLARQAFSWTLSGFSPKPLVRLQQRCLAEWYSKLLLTWEEQQEKSKLQALFFHAVYRYLLYDLERAKETLFHLSEEQLKTEGERQQYLLLGGTMEQLEGKRQVTIDAYLEAAETSFEALVNIAELAALDEAVQAILLDAGIAESDI